MKTLIQPLFHRIVLALRERYYLLLEYIALRHQMEVLKRSARRPCFVPADRCLWLLLSSWWSEWPQALEIMQADTVRRWRRQGIWHHVKWRRERKRPGRPPIPAETRNFIREMSQENRLWGAPRIHGELAKLGIKVSRTTVAKYMIRRPYPASPTWRTFIRNQAPDIFAAEVYAELSGRCHAVSTWVFQALRRWLWWLISGWPQRNGWRHVIHHTGQHDPVDSSVVSTPGISDQALVCGCSPPGSRSSSLDSRFPADQPIDVGMANVRHLPNG